MKINCLYCKREFEKKRKDHKYCSARCKSKYRKHLYIPKEKYKIICQVCNKQFISHIPHAKGCSEECRKKYKNIRARKYFMHPSRIENTRKVIRDSMKKRRLNPDMRKKELIENYEWRKKNPERWKELKEKSRLRNPETDRKRHMMRKHNERKAGKLPEYNIVKKRINLFNKACCYCGKKIKLTLEHLIAISKGGTNKKNNLFGCCKKCNCSKQNKPWHSWFSEQKFYSKERAVEIALNYLK